MKKLELLMALGAVDPAFVQEAAPKRKRSPLPYAGLAAAACLALALSLWPRQAPAPAPAEPPVSMTETGLYIRPENYSLLEQPTDMIGFFIHDDRFYVHSESYLGWTGPVGEKLGASSGLLEEWTPREGYVNGAGSVKGDFYALPGYDPEFLLCMVREDRLETYVNVSGRTLRTGADLFERLLDAGAYTAVTAETRPDWYYSKDVFYDFPDRALTDRFLEALNAGTWMPVQDVALEDADSIYDWELWHLWLKKADGTDVHLRLYTGGYVRYDPLIPACVKVDPEVFAQLIEALNGLQ